MSFAGKVVLLVGAGQAGGEGVGNGRAMVLLLARRGARLIVASITPDTLEETARQASGEGAEVETVVGDVTREADAERFVAANPRQPGLPGILAF